MRLIMPSVELNRGARRIPAAVRSSSFSRRRHRFPVARVDTQTGEVAPACSVIPDIKQRVRCAQCGRRTGGLIGGTRWENLGGMADPKHLAILEKGVEEWNRWREDNPIRPDRGVLCPSLHS